MSLHYGAQYNLVQQIGTHLFIICPNNSGSTFLRNAISLSEHVWSLQKEGQHTSGFVGPSATSIGAHLIWSTERHWLATLRDDTAYDWNISKKAWYFQASSQSPTATVFVTSSPPFLLDVQRLKDNFRNSKFIFMTRNPYAVVEGIFRRRKRLKSSRSNLLQVAAEHVIFCLQQQQRNIAAYSADGVFFTYEQLCADPTAVAAKIQGLVPTLIDLNLSQTVAVKGLYNEPLRNMNADQIARLTKEQIAQLTAYFKLHMPILTAFGYCLME